MIVLSVEKTCQEWLYAGICTLLLGLFALKGIFTTKPQEITVLTMFGEYKGSVKQKGLRWANPLYTHHKVQLKHITTNLNFQIKDVVNNPVDVSVMIKWAVEDSFRALFDKDDHKSLIEAEVKSSVRAIAGKYAFSHDEESATQRKTMSEHQKDI